MIRAAQISQCQRYRYTLVRQWSDAEPCGLWIMLNPSTADAERDDPTIRKCMELSRRAGHGGIVVVNLFAYRATDPKSLRDAADAIGPENDGVLARETERAGMIVAAWGNHGALKNRDVEAKRLIHRTMYHFGLTKMGQPRHPLYLPNAAIPIRWDSARGKGEE